MHLFKDFACEMKCWICQHNYRKGNDGMYIITLCLPGTSLFNSCSIRLLPLYDLQLLYQQILLNFPHSQTVKISYHTTAMWRQMTACPVWMGHTSPDSALFRLCHFLGTCLVAVSETLAGKCLHCLPKHHVDICLLVSHTADVVTWVVSGPAV